MGMRAARRDLGGRGGLCGLSGVFVESAGRRDESRRERFVGVGDPAAPDAGVALSARVSGNAAVGVAADLPVRSYVRTRCSVLLSSGVCSEVDTGVSSASAAG